MNAIETPIAPLLSVYVDTCAITKMTDNGFWKLLIASNEGKIKLFVSEVVVWEKTKAKHKLDETSLYHSVDRGIPLNAASFKKTLIGCKATIIVHNNDIISRANNFLKNEEAGFKIAISNELRDAHIIAAADCVLDSNTIILSNDAGFVRRVPILTTFTDVRTKEGINAFVDSLGCKKPEKNFTNHTSLTNEEIEAPFSDTLLSILDFLDPESFKKFKDDLEKIKSSEKDRKPSLLQDQDALRNQDKLESKLLNMQVADAQLRKRILGYTHWFAPTATKTDLHKLLLGKQHTPEQIECHATRLRDENLLIETNSRWLTNKHDKEANEICEQAMAFVMPEILEIMELA